MLHSDLCHLVTPLFIHSQPSQRPAGGRWETQLHPILRGAEGCSQPRGKLHPRLGTKVGDKVPKMSQRRPEAPGAWGWGGESPSWPKLMKEARRRGPGAWE